ncbi:MAG: PorV/PorQ family protein [bacterium]
MRNRATNFTASGIVLLLIAVLVVVVPAALSADDGGRTAADFLRVGLGARAAGMGEANTAASQGAEAAFWNPAGLTAMEGRGEVILGHFSWYQDISVEHGACAFRLSDRVTLAASVAFVGYGDIDGYALDGSATGEQLAAYDLGAVLSAGLALHDNLSAGISAKLINQHLDNISAHAVALDLGLRGHLGNFSVGGALVNLGRDISFAGVAEELPTSLRVGVAVSSWNDFLNTSVDIERPRRGSTIFRAGLELNFQDQYYLRGGLKVRPGEAGSAVSPGPTFGAGMRLGSADLNYAYSIGDNFTSDALHRFSLTIHIGR